MSKPLTIGALARDSGVNLETIRFYERSGLLPEPRRSPSGYRHYQEMDVRRLRFIRRGRELGFSLEEIRSLLDLAAALQKGRNLSLDGFAGFHGRSRFGNFVRALHAHLLILCSCCCLG